ncbi:hypothetical protein Q8F55_002984 [Vanrija albida]|uniref:F-box domain-containing protein n=1 Tax=Vanrija albida TaxID=181172 RepID=A0ABR3QB72_9TREE
MDEAETTKTLFLGVVPQAPEVQWGGDYAGLAPLTPLLTPLPSIFVEDTDAASPLAQPFITLSGDWKTADDLDALARALSQTPLAGLRFQACSGVHAVLAYLFTSEHFAPPPGLLLLELDLHLPQYVLDALFTFVASPRCALEHLILNIGALDMPRLAAAIEGGNTSIRTVCAHGGLLGDVDVSGGSRPKCTCATDWFERKIENEMAGPSHLVGMTRLERVLARNAYLSLRVVRPAALATLVAARVLLHAGPAHDGKGKAKAGPTSLLDLPRELVTEIAGLVPPPDALSDAQLRRLLHAAEGRGGALAGYGSSRAKHEYLAAGGMRWDRGVPAANALARAVDLGPRDRRAIAIGLRAADLASVAGGFAGVGAPAYDPYVALLEDYAGGAGDSWDDLPLEAQLGAVIDQFVEPPAGDWGDDWNTGAGAGAGAGAVGV